MQTKTSLLYWWPRVKDLGIPVPATHIVPVDRMKILSAMEGEIALTPDFMRSLHATAQLVGYPFFLRTDLQSGKHGWEKTCYVNDASVLMRNMFGVAEENEMGACFLGPGYEAFVVREFLELETGFIAFYGKMPVNKERRYFVRGSEVLCSHPYWPQSAFLDHTNDGDWQTKLAELNHESQDEVELLSRYARTVGAALPDDYWSVDFAKAKDGKWYLIDMALGVQSYHWDGCPAAADCARVFGE